MRTMCVFKKKRAVLSLQILSLFIVLEIVCFSMYMMRIQDKTKHYMDTQQEKSTKWTTTTPRGILDSRIERKQMNSSSFTKANSKVEPMCRDLIDAISLQHSPGPCADDVYLVSFVHSSMERFSQRNIIRSTWASEKIVNNKKAKIVFVLGKSYNSSLQEMINNEIQTYDDIVQYHFIDSYRNLTYKHFLGIRWVQHHCPHAKYLLKTDDDVIVKIHDVIKFTQDSPEPFQGFYCRVLEKWLVRRDKMDPYYVSAEDYNETFFPPFCMGYAYILHAKWLNGIEEQSRKMTFFWIDDAFVTGIVVHADFLFKDTFSYL